MTDVERNQDADEKHIAASDLSKSFGHMYDEDSGNS